MASYTKDVTGVTIIIMSYAGSDFCHAAYGKLRPIAYYVGIIISGT